MCKIPKSYEGCSSIKPQFNNDNIKVKVPTEPQIQGCLNKTHCLMEELEKTIQNLRGRLGPVSIFQERFEDEIPESKAKSIDPEFAPIAVGINCINRKLKDITTNLNQSIDDLKI